MENLGVKEFERREYQLKGRHKMMQFFAKWIRLELEAKPDKELTTAMLINMATGSGKTKTVGDFFNDLYELRERFYKLYPSKNWLPINALVLNDRINLVDQLRDDFFTGRKANNKPPIFSKVFREKTEVKTYHSKADELFEELDLDEDDIEAYMEQGKDIGRITVETLNKTSRKKHKDHFDFSTFQTALEADNIEQPNVIVVDEGHILTGPKYLEAFRKYYKPLPSGHYPLVIVMTATPTNKLRILTGPEIFKYGLAEYIMSPDCPKVNYNVVGTSKLTTQEKIEIYKTLDKIKNIRDAREKKRQLKEFEKYLQQALSKYISVKQLCSDFMNRVENKDHTIIFTSTIDEANKVVAELNKQAGDENFATALHSKAKRKGQDIIDDYNNGKHKVIVAVDMLNQGIDMPKTNNIVFWRHTDSALIFFQQLGRGLRGDEVNIYDYIGGIKNLVWINQVNDEIDDFVEMRHQEGENIEKKHMKISVDNLNTEPEQQAEGDFDAVKIEYVDDSAKDDKKPYEIDPKFNLSDIKDIESVAAGEESKSDDNLPPALKDLPEEKVQELVENWFNLQAIVGNMKEMREEIVLTPAEIKKVFDALGGYDSLVKYSNSELDKMKIRGYGIISIVNFYGFNSKYDYNTQSLKHFKEFLCFVYEKEFIPEVELIITEIKPYLDSLGGYEKLIKYNQDEIAGIELKGKKIHSIATTYDFKSRFDLEVKNPIGFKEFLCMVYEEEFNYAALTPAIIKAEFDRLGGYEALSKYTTSKIKELQLFENKITAIAVAYGFRSKYGLPVYYSTGFQEFIAQIYKKDFIYTPINFTKEDIKEYLDSLGGYQELVNYPANKIVKIKLGEASIWKIKKLYGFDSEYKLSVSSPAGFKEFISFVYGKEFNYQIKQKLSKELIKEALDKLGGYEKLIEYKQNDIINLSIGGHFIRSIIKVWSFSSGYGLDVTSKFGFGEFISFVYGKEFNYKSSDLESDSATAVQIIKTEFDKLGGYEVLYDWSKKQINEFKIDGNGIVNLTRIFGFVSKYGLHPQHKIGFQEFVSFIYSKEFKYEKIELTKNDIKQELDKLGSWERLLKYETNDILNLTIKGQGIIALKGFAKFSSKYGLLVNTPTGFQEFLCYIYEKDFEYVDKDSLTKEEIKEELDKLGGYEKLMTYKKEDVSNLRIKRNGIIAITKKYNFTSKYELRLSHVPGFKEFISFVYGKEFKYNPPK